MRYVLLLLAVLSMALPGAYAQRTASAVLSVAPSQVSPWHRHQDSVFQAVDRAPVSSGLLLDYGFSFVNPENYQGALLDSNYVDLGTWRLLYGGLHASVFNSNVTLPPLPAANQALAAAHQPGRVELAVLLARYQAIRPDAASANLLRVQNGLLSDVPGRSQSPYLTRTAVAVAPTEALVTTRTPTFWPGSALQFTNAAPTIQQLEADFGDGQGYRALAWDQSVTVSYFWRRTGLSSPSLGPVRNGKLRHQRHQNPAVSPHLLRRQRITQPLPV